MTRKKESDQHFLKNRLSEEMVSKLSQKKGELKEREIQSLEQERIRKIEERKKKEANKSFEELLSESELDWKKFK
jgi:hypothetical protein